MTDKEKIKFWAKGRLFEIMNGIGENDAKNILTDLLSLIDPMQGEPKTDWLQELKEKLDSLSKEDFEKVMAKYSRYGEEGSVDYDKLNTMLDESLSKETKESWNERIGEEPASDDEIEKQFKVGDIVVYMSRHPAYSGLYLLGNPNDLSIGYSNANEPYQLALRNCTIASEDERRQFMRELNDNGYKWNEVTLRIDKKEKPVSDFEMALAEMIDKAEKCVVEPWAIAAQWKDELVKLAKSEEPVSEALEKAYTEYANERLKLVRQDISDSSYSRDRKMSMDIFDGYQIEDAFEAGANWQKENLWKPADGDDLPEIDREVIALLDNGKVVFAHRPNPEGWDAKSIITEKVERYIPETYGKGGWNIPNVKWWLDCLMPKVEEN